MMVDDSSRRNEAVGKWRLPVLAFGASWTAFLIMLLITLVGGWDNPRHVGLAGMFLATAAVFIVAWRKQSIKIAFLAIPVFLLVALVRSLL
ncbi:hypothetical protein [Streptomyces sp. NPDC002994]|uniref:hypothetical protein n=1 Tax=Streptomyces sp. NPDC002994 TaxID=3154441 RepID=UPI0033AFD7C5